MAPSGMSKRQAAALWGISGPFAREALRLRIAVDRLMELSVIENALGSAAYHGFVSSIISLRWVL